jgi:hypothetical protein
MPNMMPNDLRQLEDMLDAADADAGRLTHGLSEAQGTWRAAHDSWSVAECLDHLATANRVYLAAMTPAAHRARERGRLRVGPARPGLLGRWFIRSLEPPVRPRLKGQAPQSIRPRTAPPLRDALAAFVDSQDAVRRFLRANADLDLAGVRFSNPFISALRFSLATGLRVIAAHERRHLWQAWNVRAANEKTVARSAAPLLRTSA